MFKWNLETPRGLVAGVTLLILAACQTTADAANKLSLAEVRSTFIGQEWGQGNHTFLFTQEGAFKYRKNDGTSFGGAYELKDDGTVCATNDETAPHPKRTTCFTFYRKGDGYEYYHDRSGKYWPARLK